MYREMGMTYWLQQAEAEVNGPGWRTLGIPPSRHHERREL